MLVKSLSFCSTGTVMITTGSDGSTGSSAQKTEVVDVINGESSDQ